MTSITPLSAGQWHGLLAAAGTSPAPHTLPLGRIIPSNPLHQAFSQGGYGCLVVVRGGHIEYAAHWPRHSLCDCMDGGRNQPLMECPECRGEGQVNHEAQ